MSVTYCLVFLIEEQVCIHMIPEEKVVIYFKCADSTKKPVTKILCTYPQNIKQGKYPNFQYIYTKSKLNQK